MSSQQLSLYHRNAAKRCHTQRKNSMPETKKWSQDRQLWLYWWQMLTVAPPDWPYIKIMILSQNRHLGFAMVPWLLFFLYLLVSLINAAWFSLKHSHQARMLTFRYSACDTVTLLFTKAREERNPRTSTSWFSKQPSKQACTIYTKFFFNLS